MRHVTAPGDVAGRLVLRRRGRLTPSGGRAPSVVASNSTAHMSRAFHADSPAANLGFPVAGSGRGPCVYPESDVAAARGEAHVKRRPCRGLASATIRHLLSLRCILYLRYQ